MGNSLRCCLACVIPCGALDLIRIVHLKGEVEEITRPITAAEVLNNNPNHVLTTPCSQDVVRKIFILSSESELKRGRIYFLIPESSLPDNKKRTSQTDHKKPFLKKRPIIQCQKEIDLATVECSSEKKSCRRHRRSSTGGRSATWKPYLHSIIEDQ